MRCDPGELVHHGDSVLKLNFSDLNVPEKQVEAAAHKPVSHVSKITQASYSGASDVSMQCSHREQHM